MFVAIGSNSNVGELGAEAEQGRAGIWQLDLTARTLLPYATGLRNPYRFAFNPNVDHTQFYINEVGRNQWERILPGGDDFRGANYGFPFRQGMCDTGKTEGSTCQPSEFDDAIHWYRHDEEDGGACTGGAFYPNDAGWPNDFLNTYFYAVSNIWYLYGWYGM